MESVNVSAEVRQPTESKPLASARMPKPVSYGVLILNEHNALLLAHVTDQPHWDIPKGGADAGETPMQAALRETFEETGITLQAEALEDLGPMPYTPKKSLHLFKASLHTTDWDISQCRCTSFFPHFRTGVATPEADAFRWIARAEIPNYCTRNMSAVLARLLA